MSLSKLNDPQQEHAFHVLVEWLDPDIQPWLILIHGTDVHDVRRAVLASDVGKRGGKIVSIDPA